MLSIVMRIRLTLILLVHLVILGSSLLSIIFFNTFYVIVQFYVYFFSVCIFLGKTGHCAPTHPRPPPPAHHQKVTI